MTSGTPPAAWTRSPARLTCSWSPSVSSWLRSARSMPATRPKPCSGSCRGMRTRGRSRRSSTRSRVKCRPSGLRSHPTPRLRWSGPSHGVTMPRRAAGAPEGGPLACGTRGNRSPRPSRSRPCRGSDDPAAARATASGLMEVDMRVAEVMTRNVRLIEPNQTIRDAAQLMAEMDAGIMPVREGDRLVGMITDRDIVVRAVAQGRGPDTPVREVMTDEVKYCYEDDDTSDVARNMADIQVRRLPVLTRDKRLVGIISLGDLAVTDEAGRAGEAVAGISQPGGQHSQTGGPRH